MHSFQAFAESLWLRREPLSSHGSKGIQLSLLYTCMYRRTCLCRYHTLSELLLFGSSSSSAPSNGFPSSKRTPVGVFPSPSSATLPHPSQQPTVGVLSPHLNATHTPQQPTVGVFSLPTNVTIPSQQPTVHVFSPPTNATVPSQQPTVGVFSPPTNATHPSQQPTQPPNALHPSQMPSVVSQQPVGVFSPTVQPALLSQQPATQPTEEPS